jgi:hypothetical protein
MRIAAAYRISALTNKERVCGIGDMFAYKVPHNTCSVVASHLMKAKLTKWLYIQNQIKPHSLN